MIHSSIKHNISFDITGHPNSSQTIFFGGPIAGHLKLETRQFESSYNKNSSGDEIANVNFFYNIAHVEASAYAHSTSS